MRHRHVTQISHVMLEIFLVSWLPVLMQLKFVLSAHCIVLFSLYIFFNFHIGLYAHHVDAKERVQIARTTLDNGAYTG